MHVVLSTQHKLDWAGLHDVKALEAFLQRLKDVGITADGISQKLTEALNYRLLRCTSADATLFGINKAIHAIAEFQKPIRRKRAVLRHQRLEHRSGECLSAEDIQKAVRNEAMWKHYQQTVRRVLACNVATTRDLELSMGAVMYLVKGSSPKTKIWVNVNKKDIQFQWWL